MTFPPIIRQIDRGMLSSLLVDAAAGVGLALITVGLAFISAAIALIFAGAVLIAIALIAEGR